MLKIIPLGGLGEIGLNMMVFEYGDTIFVIDAGLMFPEDYMLGIDYVIPDMSYLRANRSKVMGVILTHAHEDHVGALPYLLREVSAPVFATPFTMGMIKHKLDHFRLKSDVALHAIHAGETLKLGEFELEFIRVNHSTVDGVGLSIQTPYGQIVHTGDFKISNNPIGATGTDVNAFARCGQEGVLLLMSDSTNVEKDGYTISDQDVGETITGIGSTASGRMIVALFASSIPRIQQAVKTARVTGRKIIFNGKSVETSVEIARRLGYLRIPAELEIDISQVHEYPDNEILIVTTGSQGEPMAALSRMASGNHQHIRIKKEDTVILSSKFIPGNEKAITGIINSLYRRGADVVYEKISDIHVSGHAFREELKLMINLTRPQYFIPIHGEYRHLTLHSRLAREVGIPADKIEIVENGQIICVDKKGVRTYGDVQIGRVLVDGKGVGDVGRSVLKERQVLSEEGLVIVNMAIDEESGYIIYGPKLASRGFVFETETGHLLEDAKCVILEIVDEIGPDTAHRVEKIRSKVQSALRKYFSFTIKRRPVILPFILEV
ncbi:MAG: Ribonuclease J (endonuclease and 5' exonuclease) [Olavius algarvensis Delta 4 endosymbiont]|nr:MAG: Ribonuclease J (endonuclease and 5' exonuclease) [Olavius algarvensis Delta 4 endosymbiont]